MFKKELANVDLKMGKNSILIEALQVFKQLFYGCKAKAVRDRYGTIAYKIGECYLVAKKSPYGDIVSVHKQIWDKAKEEGGQIYLYLQSSGFFYRFSPQVNFTTVINERGGIPMVNFDIRHGRNLLKIKAMQNRIKERIRKNQEYFGRETGTETKEERSRRILMIACS